jgi:hypothetical protein
MDSSVSPKDKIWFLRMCHHISNAVYNPQQRSNKYISRSVSNCKVNDLWYSNWSHAITGAKQRSHNEAKTESKELPLDDALHLTLFDVWTLNFFRIQNGKKKFPKLSLLKRRLLTWLSEKKRNLCDVANC